MDATNLDTKKKKQKKQKKQQKYILINVSEVQVWPCNTEAFKIIISF